MQDCRRFTVALVTAVSAVVGLVLTGCASPTAAADTKLRIVTTTALLADMTRNVVGDDASVTSLIPPNADPHTYEPTLRDVRNLAYADVTLANHLLLEEQALTRTMRANTRPGVSVTEVAEESPRYGGRLIALVEDAKLNTVWLGMRVRQADPTVSGVEFRAQSLEAPGDLAAYLTGTFGQPRPYFASSDGIDNHDVAALPPNAHTHMSWAFTEPGVYKLKLAAAKQHGKFRAGQNNQVSAGGRPEAAATVTFAVGIDPAPVARKLAAQTGKSVTTINRGHVDISFNAAQNQIEFFGDRQDGQVGDTVYNPETTVIAVPNAALGQVPARPEYRFIGQPGSTIYVLAQAVLGKHVHGEIDPHVWQSVPNVIAMVQVIRDVVSAADPAHAKEYSQRTAAYIQTLQKLDTYVRSTLQTIPSERRNLVTPHDAYGYLGATYNMQIAGFVTPNPGIEPSSTDMIALTRTLDALKVPAVFVEPALRGRVKELTQAAGARGLKVCSIYGDSLDEKVTTYVQMMATNAYNLAVCLYPEAAPPPRFDPHKPQLNKTLRGLPAPTKPFTQTKEQ